ncbi:hypothetical protein KSS87_012322 [Heliosperma pusillum]|nr:hypothetical protein KSS87_012322 [Heliosperma pusillum]
MGLELGKVKIKRFADGEIYVQLEESVRGCDVFIIQPTGPPVNENLMELQIMIDACLRASAKTITAVIPYFGYARADRKILEREAIPAKLAANLITGAGANRVLACDLHSGQSMGYFDIPIDQVYCQPVILDYLASKCIASSDLVVVSPDVGGVARARAFAKKLSDAPLAIVDKRRQAHNVAEVMNLIGDVKGKVAVMVDDMIDTAGTITKGAELLHAEGAREVYACCTHAVFRICMVHTRTSSDPLLPLNPEIQRTLAWLGGGIRRDQEPPIIEEIDSTTQHHQVEDIHSSPSTSTNNTFLIAKGNTSHVKFCGLCNDPTHPTDGCPSLFEEEGNEVVNALGSYGQNQRRNDPFSNTYNAGTKNHPNFKWDQSGNNNQRGAIKFLLHKTSPIPKGRLKPTFKILGRSLGQILNVVSQQPTQGGRLPSQTIPPPTEQAQAVSLRNGSELEELPKPPKKSIPPQIFHEIDDLVEE